MRNLVVVVVIQTLLLVLLIIKISNIEQKLIISQQSTVQAHQSVNHEKQSNALPVNTTAPNEKLIIEIKQMVTQQLDEFLVQLKTTDDNSKLSSNIPPPSSQEEQQNIVNIAYQRIDDFMTQGAITEKEMWQIEQDLAKLDVNNRADVLRKLSKAVNSGSIKISK